MRVLDVGCGIGKTNPSPGGWFGPARQVPAVGIDSSEERFGVCRDTLVQTKTLQFLRRDFTLPLSWT